MLIIFSVRTHLRECAEVYRGVEDAGVELVVSGLYTVEVNPERHISIGQKGQYS